MVTTSIQQFVCGQCDKEFKSQKAVSQHLSMVHSGKIRNTDNHKLNCQCFICKAKRGETTGINNSFYGKIHSSKTIRKMHDAKFGKTYEEIYGKEKGKFMRNVRKQQWTAQLQDLSIESKRRLSISKSKTGVLFSEQHKKKLSEVWDIGHTAEVIQKMGVTSRSRYLRGYFKSYKNNCEIYFQSSYELYAFIRLEHDDNVQSFGRCHFTIPYIYKGKMRRYLPDIGVQYIDGTKSIIETKALINDPENIVKFDSGREYCRENGMSYIVWSENDTIKYKQR